MASARPRDSASPSPTPVSLSRSPRRWNGRKTRSRSGAGMPGPRSITRTSTRSPSALAVTVTRLGVRAVAQGVGDQVGQDPSRAERGSASTSGQPVRNLDLDPAARRRDVVDGEGNHLLHRHRLLASASAPAWRRLMSSRLATSRSSRSSDSVAVARSSARSSSRPGHVGARQALDGGLGRRQRGAQVVADRVQQRGPHPVGLGQRPGLLGLLGQPLLPKRDRGLGGERLEDPPVVGAQRPTAQDQGEVLADRDLGLALVRSRAGLTADRGDDPPRLWVALRRRRQAGARRRARGA